MSGTISRRMGKKWFFFNILSFWTGLEPLPKLRVLNIIPAYNYGTADADRQILQQVCDEEGADLFISTYYTTPLSTPSVFMAYDMIPEVLQANLNEQMWREKHHGIRHASAYIAISENTAQDLVKFFPNIALGSVSVAHLASSISLFRQLVKKRLVILKISMAFQNPTSFQSGVARTIKILNCFFKPLLNLAVSKDLRLFVQEVVFY